MTGVDRLRFRQPAREEIGGTLGGYPAQLATEK